MIRDLVVANGTLWVAFLKHCLVLLVGRPELSDGGLCIKAKVRKLRSSRRGAVVNESD